MKLPKLKFNTISSRFTLIVSVAVVGCMFAVQLASYFILRQTVTEHGQATMQVANDNIGLEIEDNYTSLVQMSQLMVDYGMVGDAFLDYLQANTYMERKNSSETLNELLTTSIFSADAHLATYYNMERGYNYMEGHQSLKDTFRLDTLHPLHKRGEITCYAPHTTQKLLSGILVVSLSRPSKFGGDGSTVIYAEKSIHIDSLIKIYQKSYERSFTFLQLDEDGIVRYSAEPAIASGTDFSQMTRPEETFGRWKNYFWTSRPGAYGGYTVLLTPVQEFFGDVYLQLRFFAIAVVFSIFLILIAVVLLNELIIKKNTILQQEIQRVGEGNLDRVTQHTGLQDYDLLLDRFDWMTQQLHRQMLEIEAVERRNGDIEREILYYQINPHFLLNSLNSAYWQAKMNIKGGIDKYIAQLTTILRYSLGKDTEAPTLGKEIEILALYLQLQQKRRSFTYTLDVQPGAYLRMPAPRLFIQPIVENSIEHGMDEGDHITIRVLQTGDWVHILIRDNGIGMSPEVLQQIEENMEKYNSRAGIGLRYVKTMISSLYGDRATMHIDSKEGVGTRVFLCLPLEDV